MSAKQAITVLKDKFGIWLIGGLLAVNGFFIRGLVQTINDSSTAVIQLKADVAQIQPAMAGMTELRVQFAVLQTKVEMLTKSIDGSNLKRLQKTDR